MARYSTFHSSTAHNTPPPPVSIDEAAQALRVERRRIYDIINILESVHIVSRKCKNTYRWHGTEALGVVFAKLQREAFEIWGDDARSNGLLKGEPKAGRGGLHGDGEGVPYSARLHRQKVDADATVSSSSSAVVKEKSLGKLSQKFVQLFLVGHNILSLTDASDYILGTSTPSDLARLAEVCDSKNRSKRSAARRRAEDVSKKAARGLKTKIRRLYDIANVLVSIGVIEKVGAQGGQDVARMKSKPSFRWSFHVKPRDMPRLLQKEETAELAAKEVDGSECGGRSSGGIDQGSALVGSGTCTVTTENDGRSTSLREPHLPRVLPSLKTKNNSSILASPACKMGHLTPSTSSSSNIISIETQSPRTGNLVVDDSQSLTDDVNDTVVPASSVVAPSTVQKKVQDPIDVRVAPRDVHDLEAHDNAAKAVTVEESLVSTKEGPDA